MTYIICGLEFKTKKQLETYAKDILYSGTLNEPVTGPDLAFMYDYFKKMHVEFDMKEGCGLQSIVRITEPLYGKYRGFKLVRIDGSYTDISYILSNITKKNLLRDLKQALRAAIEPQLNAFKLSQLAENPQMKCPFTLESLYYGHSHVDHHEPTFEQLVSTFVQMHNLNDQRIKEIISQPADNQLLSELTDESLKQSFCEFHEKNAKLRLLSPLGNLSHAKISTAL